MATPILAQRLRYLSEAHQLLARQTNYLRAIRVRLPSDLQRAIPNKFLACEPTVREMRRSLSSIAMQSFTRKAKGG